MTPQTCSRVRSISRRLLLLAAEDCKGTQCFFENDVALEESDARSRATTEDEFILDEGTRKSVFAQLYQEDIKGRIQRKLAEQKEATSKPRCYNKSKMESLKGDTDDDEEYPPVINILPDSGCTRVKPSSLAH